MHWVKRHLWKTSIAVASTLLLLGLSVWLLMFVVLVPASADAYGGVVGHAIAGTVQATPTEDATMAALQKEQLTQQVRQLDNWWLYWLYNGSTAFIAAFATVIVALFGIYQWAGNRKKDLSAQVDERFKTAIAALGSANEATQIGGAILLRSFLNPKDKRIYGRYYTQIFDLAVAYLRLSNTPQPSKVPDGLPPQPEDPNAPLPLTPLRQALITVFKESFPLARERLGQVRTALGTRSLDASYVRLDNLFLDMSDLAHIWMLDASLRNATILYTDMSTSALIRANLSGANLGRIKLRGASLIEANLSSANLSDANLSGAYLIKADLSSANLSDANLSKANLEGANLSGAILRGADLRGADLTGANIEDAQSLKDTKLYGVKGLSKEQLTACKAKGAIIDGNTTNNVTQIIISSSPLFEINNAHTPQAPPAQATTPPASTDGSNSTVSQQTTEP